MFKTFIDLFMLKQNYTVTCWCDIHCIDVSVNGVHMTSYHTEILVIKNADQILI